MAAEHEREFQIHQLFFSTTDRKGVIVSGNEVFSRIAAYEESEMVGRPHSLIRHPEMPRCVFKLLWDTIARGEAIAAYVKNRASTGEPYWCRAPSATCRCVVPTPPKLIASGLPAGAADPARAPPV
jgi:PAS domain S-box-containing protein